MTQNSTQNSTRECGDCNACCIILPVTPLNKPAGVPCEHLCQSDEGCCSIYDKKPSACTTYECAWLEEFIPIEAQPTEIGVVFERMWVEFPKRLDILMAMPIYDGALDENIELIESIAQDGVVVMAVEFDRYPREWGNSEDLEAWQINKKNIAAQGEILMVTPDGVERHKVEEL